MRPEHAIRQMCADYWPDRRASPSAPFPYGIRDSLGGGAAEFRGRDLLDELAPAHPAGVADDVDARQPRALDDVVADARGLHARHLADVVAQAAGDAELLVAVVV